GATAAGLAPLLRRWLARPPVGPDDDDEPARVRAAGERRGDRAEDARQAYRQRLPSGLVVDGGARVIEPVRTGDAPEPVAERADPARDPARPVDVAGAVQDVDAHLPGGRKGRGVRARRGAGAMGGRGGEGDRGRGAGARTG